MGNRIERVTLLVGIMGVVSGIGLLINWIVNGGPFSGHPLLFILFGMLGVIVLGGILVVLSLLTRLGYWIWTGKGID